MDAKYLKGQYFSFDAIIAAVIFALAISVLSSHWVALRAQMDGSDTYLQQEAYRISDVLLGAGEPVYATRGDPRNWYLSPQNAKRAGLAISNSNPNLLNYTTIEQMHNLNTPANYEQWALLLSTGANFWVEINMTNATDPGRPYNFLFGQAPADKSKAQIVQVRRAVAVQQDIIGGNKYYWANLTVFTWSGKGFR